MTLDHYISPDVASSVQQEYQPFLNRLSFGREGSYNSEFYRTEDFVPRMPGVGPMHYNHGLNQASRSKQFNDPSSYRGQGVGPVFDRGAAGNVPQGSRAVKNVNPPSFEGQLSFKDFLVPFELVAKLAGWQEEVMGLELAGSLKGAAVAVLSDLQPYERIHYPTLVRALMNRFEPINQNQLYKAQLRSRCRKSGESIPELTQDISRLVRNACGELSSVHRDSIAKDAFIESLNSRDLELAVFQGRPKNLQDAVNIALEYEAFQVTRQKKSTYSAVMECFVEGSSCSDSSLVDRISQLERELDSLRVTKVDSSLDGRGVSTTGKTVRGKSGLTCFQSGEVGHFKANCPQKRSGKIDNSGNFQDKSMVLKCDYCGKQGHTFANCFKRPKFQDNVAMYLFCGQKGHFMISCEYYKGHISSNTNSEESLKGNRLM